MWQTLRSMHRVSCRVSCSLARPVQEQRNAVARFLDAREMKQEALEIATDPDYRFDLAVSLGKLGTALELAEQSGSELKWRQLGELALSAGKLQVQTAS